jgi:hypothetical protein
MTHAGLVAGFVAAAVMSGGVTFRANEPLTLELKRRFYLAPANVAIKVIVEPNVQNRLLHIEADGPAMFSSTDLELAGEDAARTHDVVFKNLPAGPYVVTAVLLSQEKQRAMVAMSLDVKESGQAPSR